MDCLHHGRQPFFNFKINSQRAKQKCDSITITNKRRCASLVQQLLFTSFLQKNI